PTFVAWRGSGSSTLSVFPEVLEVMPSIRSDPRLSHPPSRSPSMRRVDSAAMKILVVGCGGVGAAFAPIAARRDFYEHIVFADHHEDRARSVVQRYDKGTGRFSAATLDASDPAAITELCRTEGITHVLNAVDPRLVMPIFTGAFEAGTTYLDMALSLSEPHPEEPYG